MGVCVPRVVVALSRCCCVVFFRFFAATVTCLAGVDTARATRNVPGMARFDISLCSPDINALFENIWTVLIGVCTWYYTYQYVYVFPILVSLCPEK